MAAFSVLRLRTHRRSIVIPSLFSALVLVASLQGFATTTVYTTPQIMQIIVSAAKENGLNSDHFLSVAQCESGLNPTIQSGYFDKKGIQERSFGLWQIDLDAHPEITLEEANNPVWSTEYASQEWKNDRYKQWECWSLLYGSME